MPTPRAIAGGKRGAPNGSRGGGRPTLLSEGGHTVPVHAAVELLGGEQAEPYGLALAVA